MSVNLTSEKPFRVLSLNGGGARALFQAHFLEFVSAKPGIGAFWKDFDLIIGTSAGAIVAGGLWAKLSANEIANLFDTVGKDAFPKPLWNGMRITLRMAAAGNSVSIAPLKKILTEVYGADTTLGDYDKPLLAITATEIEKSQIRVFSPLTQAKDRYLNLVDVVMASAALPGVFPDYPVLDAEAWQVPPLCGWLPLGQRAVACCCRANHTEWEGVLTRHSRCQHRDYRSTLFNQPRRISKTHREFLGVLRLPIPYDIISCRACFLCGG